MDFLTIIITGIGIMAFVFIPGLALTLAFFPKRKDMDNIERTALSFILGLTPQFVLYFLDKNLLIPVTFATTALTISAVTIVSLVVWNFRKNTKKITLPFS